MSTVTMKETIQNKLLLRLGRQWQVGDRLPPIRELARELGAGQSNTHEAVRMLTANGLLKSRQRAGTFVIRLPEVGVVPEADRGLRGNTLTMITFTPRPLGFVSRMTDAFVKEALAHDATVNHLELETRNCKFAWPDDADAVALFNPSRRFVMDLPARQRIAVASTAWTVVSLLPEGVDAIGVNDQQGGYLAGKRIAGQSPQDVGFIGVTLDWPEDQRWDLISTMRLTGFESGWGESMRKQSMLAVQGHSMLSGGKAFGQYMRLPHRPRILFAASDDLAVGFCAAASASDLKPGRDFHIIGFDGQERGRHLIDGSLATVVAPLEEMGQRLVHLLIDRFKQPDRPSHRLQLDCSFYLGNTISFTKEG